MFREEPDESNLTRVCPYCGKKGKCKRISCKSELRAGGYQQWSVSVWYCENCKQTHQTQIEEW